MNDLRRKLLAAFEVEHRDHIAAARRMLDGLESAGWKPAAIDLVELHRRVHSLKGAARAVDLRPLEALAHRLESAITLCQAGDLALDARVSTVIRLALDAIEDAVAGMQEDGTVAVPAEVTAAMAALSDPDQVAAERQAESSPLAPAPTAAAGLAVLPSRSLWVDAAGLEGLFESTVEILAATSAQQRLGDVFETLAQELEEARRLIGALRRGGPDRPGSGHNGVLDLASARRVRELEAWIDRFGAGLRAVADQQRAAGRQNRQWARRLEAQVRRMRLVSADAVFGGLRQMVRDLGAGEGKQVRLDVRGLDTLADRAVLQGLRDPVLHVLRNAVTHGIETAGERTSAGKPREGRIVLDIAARSGRLTLRVEDDGRGIDVDRVRRAAVERGHWPADGRQAVDWRLLTELLSEPGFSTAGAVTELAGRGMGLSVVATTVARMLGDFSIAPHSTGGTVVTVSVPVSLSASRLILVRCRDQLYGIPAHGVERLYSVPRDEVDTVEGWPVVRFGGAAPIRLVALSRLLGEGPDTADPAASLPVVVLRVRGVRIGVVAQSLAAVRDGVVRDLGRRAGDVLAGGMVTEDGDVVPVLDPQSLLDRAAGLAAHPVVHRAAAGDQPAPAIMVVDDSITTRTLEKSILEASGFRVRLSVDGADALAQLRAEPVDLVISDIEMPRMDGFELLRAMKRDDALASIPVVLVTSRDSDQDRSRGLSLGADAYVVKQRFDQTDLLAAIRQLL